MTVKSESIQNSPSDKQPNQNEVSPTPPTQSLPAAEVQQRFNLCAGFPHDKVTFLEGKWTNSGALNGCNVSGEYVFNLDKFKFTESICGEVSVSEGEFSINKTSDNGYYLSMKKVDGTVSYGVIQLNEPDFGRLNLGHRTSQPPSGVSGVVFNSHVFRDNAQKQDPCAFYSPSPGKLASPSPETKKLDELNQISFPKGYEQFGFSFPMEDRIHLSNKGLVVLTRGGIAVVEREQGAWSSKALGFGGRWQLLTANENEILAGNPSYQASGGSDGKSLLKNAGATLSVDWNGQPLSSESGTESESYLGDGLAMNENWKFIGKPSGNYGQAEVRVYKRNNGNWVLHQSISESEKIGEVIRLNEDTLAIESSSGVFIYRFDSGLDRWIKIQRMSAGEMVMDISLKHYVQRFRSGKTYAVKVFSFNQDSKQYELSDTLFFPSLGSIESVRLVGNKLAIAGGAFESASVLVFESDANGKFSLKTRYVPPVSDKAESCFGMGLNLNEVELVTSDNCYGTNGIRDMLYHGRL